MCRSIKTLYNFEPPASIEEIRASALQYVRKLSGMPRPARANVEAFERAVGEVAAATQTLLDGLVTRALPRDREIERLKAAERGRRREAGTRAAGSPERP